LRAFVMCSNTGSKLSKAAHALEELWAKDCELQASCTVLQLEFRDGAWESDPRGWTASEWRSCFHLDGRCEVSQQKDTTLMACPQLRVTLSGLCATMRPAAGHCGLVAMHRFLNSTLPCFSDRHPASLLRYAVYCRVMSGSAERTVQRVDCWEEEVDFLLMHFDSGSHTTVGFADTLRAMVFGVSFREAGVCEETLNTSSGKEWFPDGDNAGAHRAAGNELCQVRIVVASTNFSGVCEAFVVRNPESRHTFVQEVAQQCKATVMDVVVIAVGFPGYLSCEEVCGYELVFASGCSDGTLSAAAVRYGLPPRCHASLGTAGHVKPLPQAQAHDDVQDSSASLVPQWDDADPIAAAVAFLQRAPADDHATALLDLGILEQRWLLWKMLLPRVTPFYAVKCNPHPAIVQHLWELYGDSGGGFDCATPSEIALVTSMGIPAQRVVFAHPCKQQSAIDFARDTGVRWMTFDNKTELTKIWRSFPDAPLLIRIQTDDAGAQCPLSNKFGAAPGACSELLHEARRLGLRVEGVSFHVGSGCSQRGVFLSAMRRAHSVFQTGRALGLSLCVLDIGGGFSGNDQDGTACFADHARDINQALEELFSDAKVSVIAEPGRFFAASTQTLITTVTSVAGSVSGGAFRYYLNDGVYGSFNCLLYDHARVPTPVVIRDNHVLACGSPVFRSTVFGPTCDGLDKLLVDIELPQLQVNDRLLFRNMGAYTSAASTTFNGFPLPKTVVLRGVGA